jgi:hypothetical protein
MLGLTRAIFILKDSKSDEGENVLDECQFSTDVNYKEREGFYTLTP